MAASPHRTSSFPADTHRFIIEALQAQSLPVRRGHSSATFEFLAAIVLVAGNANLVIRAASSAALLDALLTTACHQLAEARSTILRHTLRLRHARAGTGRGCQSLHAALHHARGEVRLPTFLALARVALNLNRATETRLLGQGHSQEHGDGDHSGEHVARRNLQWSSGTAKLEATTA